jgi:hypothetical protein
MKRFIKPFWQQANRSKSEFIRLPGLFLNYSSDTGRRNTKIIYTDTTWRKRDLKDLLLIIILIILMSAHVLGESAKKSCVANFVTDPPVIDGKLDDKSWTNGAWIDDFRQFDPSNNASPSERTAFKIVFDDNNLYVAMKAFDRNADSIVTRLTRRDQTDGDLLAICIDSYHDLRTGFLFGVSSAGVKYDIVFTDDGKNQDDTWDPNWLVKTTRTNDGWFAEMEIPFSQIRFEKNAAEIWGLQIARVIYRKNETDFWQDIPKDAPGLIHMFGELKGLDKIKPRKIFDITPYVLSQAEMYAPDQANPFRSSGKNYNFKGGIDSKIGITNNLTMDITINPDFGQVEADPSVVNLTAFETFYREQRPFFIEGKNITDFNIGIGDDREGNDNLFYSRRIGRMPQCSPRDLKDGWSSEIPKFTNISGAAKITGKTQNGWSLGFIDAVTAPEKAKIDTIGGRTFQLVEPLTNYFVGRVQKDINSGKTIIGAIVTGANRDLDSSMAQVLHKAAFTGGFDFTQYFRNKNWMFTMNSAFSFVEGSEAAILKTQEGPTRYFQRPDNNYVDYKTDRTSLSGSGGKMAIVKQNGHINFMSAFLWKSPGFEINDLGYLRQADQLFGVVSASYNQWEPKGIYKRYNISCDLYSLFDFGGDNLARGMEANGNITFRNFWGAYFSGSLTTNQISTSLLRGGPGMRTPGNYSFNLGFSTDNRKKFIFSINSGKTGQYLNSSGSLFASLKMQYKPTDYFIISFSPQSSVSYDHLQYVTNLARDNDQRYIFGTIHHKIIAASLRMNFNITPDLTIQYWGQPFMVSGKYSEYKYITNPMATSYEDRYHVYSASQIIRDGDNYSIDENEDGRPDYSIETADFNYQNFLSNLVIRWEYNPGSTVYLVWSQTRDNYANSGVMGYDCLSSLFGSKPTNIFLIKFSYRFGLR